MSDDDEPEGKRERKKRAPGRFKYMKPNISKDCFTPWDCSSVVAFKWMKENIELLDERKYDSILNQCERRSKRFVDKLQKEFIKEFVTKVSHEQDLMDTVKVAVQEADERKKKNRKLQDYDLHNYIRQCEENHTAEDDDEIRVLEDGEEKTSRKKRKHDDIKEYDATSTSSKESKDAGVMDEEALLRAPASPSESYSEPIEKFFQKRNIRVKDKNGNELKFRFDGDNLILD